MKFFKKIIWQLLYKNKNEFTVSVRDNTVYFDTSNKYSKKWFFPRVGKVRIHEPGLLREIEQYMQQDSVFFDVGSHLGYFSCMLAVGYPERRVYSFEMNPYSIVQIKNNIEENKFKNVHVINAAISDKDGLISIQDPEIPNPGGQIRKGNNKKLEIPSLTIDRYCIDNNLKPDILKIDVEGAELQVLKGMTKLLNRGCILFIEVHPVKLFDFNTNASELLCYLNNFDYSLDLIIDHRQRGSEIKRISPSYRLESNTMIIAKPNAT